MDNPILSQGLINNNTNYIVYAFKFYKEDFKEVEFSTFLCKLDISAANIYEIRMVINLKI